MGAVNSGSARWRISPPDIDYYGSVVYGCRMGAEFSVLTEE